MNNWVPEPVPYNHSEMPSLVDQSCGTQVSIAGFVKPWMKPAKEVTSTSICSTLLGVPTAGSTGAGGVAGLEIATELPAPLKVQKPSGRPPAGQAVPGATPLSKSSMIVPISGTIGARLKAQ